MDDNIVLYEWSVSQVLMQKFDRTYRLLVPSYWDTPCSYVFVQFRGLAKTNFHLYDSAWPTNLQLSLERVYRANESNRNVHKEVFFYR
ncbi:hypothetical protein BDZ45DRAFT_667765 [Acephala macrosclerotiorum]|nr:hypothetical protein BDZ45DRAFT_667765 [Acephala macrosclerotiorum]